MQKISISCLLILFTGFLQAQGDLLIYSQQDIPQSAYTNPANRFDGKFFIGIPALSSVDLEYSNRFRYSDLVVKSGDSLLLDFDRLLSDMKENNYLSMGARVDLLSFGITLSEKLQVHFNVSEVAAFNFGINRDMVRFIYRGNAAFENRDANFDGLGLNASHYREYGLGASLQLNEKWRLGARAKYLYGMENIYTERMDINFRTDPETYALRANTNFAIRSSGIDLPSAFEESDLEYLSERNNHGFAFDLGAHYQMNEQLSFSASVVDWGSINWNDYNMHYFGEGDFTYDGIEINSFTDPNQELGNETSFDRVLDSLEANLGVEEGKESYRSPLVSRVFIGSSLNIDQFSQLNFLIRNDIFAAKLRPSFSISYSRQLSKLIRLSGAYSSLNHTFDNLGLGITVDPGPIQFYLMTDNAIGLFQPQHARNVHLRFGMNLIFGREKIGPRTNVAKKKNRKARRKVKTRNRSIQKSDF